MDDYAGRVLAERYRLPRPPSDEYDFVETRAFDTYSGHEVVIRQIPLPEVVDAEMVEPGTVGLAGGPAGGRARPRHPVRATRTPDDPAVRRAVDAATAAAALPDHPRLHQVFDVFAEGGSLWVVSEMVAARPLAALLAERPMSPHRAAELAADVLTALRALHAHGWTHRNITTRTVLVCHDGRAVLTGLAAGAAEEALCGYDPVPRPSEGTSGGPAPALAPRPGGAIAAYRAGTQAGIRARGGAGAPPAGPGAPELPAPREGFAFALSKNPAGDGGWDGPERAEDRGTGAEALTPVGPGVRAGTPPTALAAERARQARILVVGGVTERWAPEQAGPVHGNWQLAPPVGPATDLWGLGALLYRAVQGHAPYPEDNAAELVRLVCSEDPAYAEDCGALRPVVESLLRQEPDERPEIEELRGWLRSLIRSAPEPDVGSRTVTVPALDHMPAAGALRGAGDPGRLPIVRRRGELVRRRRPGASAAASRHKGDGEPRRPRSLGRVLLGAILLVLVAAVAYAVLFMPRQGEGGNDRNGAEKPGSSATTPAPDPQGTGSGESDSDETQSTAPAGLAKGFAIRKDPGGFQLAVRDGWKRRGENARGQIRYVGDDGCELIVVPGRDSVDTFGGDPMAYQQEKESELDAFRQSSWSSASGLRRIDVGRTAMAEGAFHWKDSSGREVFGRNLAMIIGGRYHTVLVIGPTDRQDDVERYYEQASTTYRTSG